VSRLSEEAVTAEDDDPSGAQFRYEKGVLNGAPYKVPLTTNLSLSLCVSRSELTVCSCPRWRTSTWEMW
jgi:hypothetical protein